MNLYIWTINPVATNCSGTHPKPLYRATFEDKMDMKVRYHGKLWIELDRSDDFVGTMREALADAHDTMDVMTEQGEPVDNVIMGSISIVNLHI